MYVLLSCLSYYFIRDDILLSLFLSAKSIKNQNKNRNYSNYFNKRNSDNL